MVARCCWSILPLLLLLVGLVVAEERGVVFVEPARDTAQLQWKPTQCGPGNIITQWGKEVNPNKVIPDYPRPMMRRAENTWQNLNGLWQFQPANEGDQPPFGRSLSGTILVPFPVESCLSGVGQNYQRLWYRLVFNRPKDFTGGRVLLHFGAVDWQTKVWFQRTLLGNHTGGYDSFSFDITSLIQPTNNELIVHVYDPSDLGFQPNGKQRISAINNPGGDTYTPSSGIWQTVWLENVPNTYISDFRVLPNMTHVTLSAVTVPAATTVTFRAFDGNSMIAVASAISGQPVTMAIPNPKIWDPTSPFLYHLQISTPGDFVLAYFGLRSVSLGHYRHKGIPDTGPQANIDRPGGDMPGYPVVLPQADPNLCWNMCKTTSGCKAWAYAVPGCDTFAKPMCWLKSSNPGATSNKCRVSGSLAVAPFDARRPFINNRFLFLAGWLDQSFWPDGLYTAPTDDALQFDLQILKTFGLNTIRLHQKVNPERWYWYADKLGIIVLQDMVQKYGGATQQTIPPFVSDAKAAIEGKYNHPSIIQWEVFNEEDCVDVFNASETVRRVQQMDPSRLVDTDSGGPANDLHIADVNDFHNYPYPGNPLASATQYAMQGEFGGIGAFIAGHEWVPGQCQTYLHVDTPQDEADTYVKMAQMMQAQKEDLSVSIYTQIADVERECDGFLNYDRTHKFTPKQIEQIRQANYNLINK